MIVTLLNPKPAAAVTALLFALLTVLTPIVNADAGPPRSVFLKLPSDTPPPDLDLAAQIMPSGALRLDVLAKDFRFTDVCVSRAEGAPVGHAHISVNGIKVASAYQPRVYLEALPPGSHRIRAVLRGQDHRALVGADGLISAELWVVVPPAQG